MRRLGLVVLLALAAPAFAAGDDLTRPVTAQTIISPELPKAKLTIAPGLSYVGGQHFFLSGRTDVEQYFFVDAAPDGGIRRGLWIQFEHKMPENNGSYNYTPGRTLEIGGLSFLYDTKVYTDYPGVKPAAGSDVEHARALLAAKGLKLPVTASRVRMFNAPGTDKRSELMVIYIEALGADKMPPDAGNDMPSDDKYPALSASIVQHAQQALSIQRN